MPPILRSSQSPSVHRVEGADVPHDLVTGELKVQRTVLSMSTSVKDDENTLLSWLFGSRVRVFTANATDVPDALICGTGANGLPHGTTYELVTSRERDDGNRFWGGTIKTIDWFYIETHGWRAKGEVQLTPLHDLEQKLGEYANFGALTPRKAAARLQLLTSPAAGEHIHPFVGPSIEF